MRKITVFSTKGVQKKSYETDVTTWADAKALIGRDYDLKTLAATESINRTDLVNDQAILPEGDFTIFLRPIKTKSGVYSFAEARKQLTSEDKKWIEDNLKKNWTRASTDELNQCLSRNGAGKEPTKDNGVGKVVESVKTTKAGKPVTKEQAVEKVEAQEVADTTKSSVQTMRMADKEDVEKVIVKIEVGIKEIKTLVPAEKIIALEEGAEELRAMFSLPAGEAQQIKIATEQARLAAIETDKVETDRLAKEFAEIQKGY